MRLIVEPYKYIEGVRIKEKGALQFEKNLQDDYVKFIAWSEKTATATGLGIVAIISNNGFLDTPTLRGMRWHLNNTFSKLYFLDLHGSTKRPINGDDSVFEIQQGVAISFFIKSFSDNQGSKTIFRSDLLGSRNFKYKFLEKEYLFTTNWKGISVLQPNYQFLDLDIEIKSEYDQYISLPEMMPFYSSGTETGFNSLLVNFTKSELLERIK